MRDPHDREIELSFWESVRASDNPALVQAYLEKYPKGEFSALAQILASELMPEIPPASDVGIGEVDSPAAPLTGR